MPEWAAAITFSIFILLNLAFIVLSLYKFYDIDIEVTATSGIVTMVLLYIVNYILFIHKNKFLEIETYFDKQAKNKLKLKSAFFFTYIILTISLFVLFYIK